MAGSTVAQLMKQQQQQTNNNSKILAYVAVGYTFGKFASLGFGRHFSSVVTSSLPKLFIMGEGDEFTSADQLEKMVHKMRANGTVDVEIVANVGHFELESPSYDRLVANVVLNWLHKVGVA